MSVTVHLAGNRLRLPEDPGPTPVVHDAARATLVDGRGQLLVLDTADLDLGDGELGVGILTRALIRHTLACYADGEWTRTETFR